MLGCHQENQNTDEEKYESVELERISLVSLVSRYIIQKCQSLFSYFFTPVK